MPIHIGELQSEVEVADGDAPLSEAQIERLVAIILRRIEQVQRARASAREATVIRRSSAPPPPIES
jgi:hypothetical protein